MKDAALREIILKNRSFRRFEEGYCIKRPILEGLIDLARNSPSAANLQPLRYIISCDAEKNKLIFPHLGWAGYLKNTWHGPKEGERPSAYIIIVGDRSYSKYLEYDTGIACQSILLGAVSLGLGGCIVASINKEEIRSLFNIDSRYEIIVVIALGRPAEKVVIDEIDSSGDIRYWRDKDDAHHVPKIRLKDIIIG